MRSLRVEEPPEDFIATPDDYDRNGPAGPPTYARNTEAMIDDNPNQPR